MKNFSFLLFYIILSAAISSASIWYYDSHYTTKIAAFDLREYINNLKNNLVDGKINETELSSEIDKLKAALDKQSGKKIILLEEVIISGDIETIKISD